MKTNKYLIVFCLLFFLSKLYCQIVINEISNNNSSTIYDEQGKSRDWIELYNSSSSVINLAGYSITDDSTNLKKWIFSNIEMDPKSYLLLMASGDNVILKYVHLNFKLAKEGETLRLIDPSGNIIDKHFVGILQINNSIGRNPDGSDNWCLFSKGTPEALNDKPTCYTGYQPDPEFSLEAGFYPYGQSLSISSPTGAKINYTTNGDFPSSTSPDYTNEISITKTVVISAMISGTDKLLPSNTIKNTYFIDEDKLDLPIFSISMKPADLWDSSKGIYVMGPNASTIFPYRGANFWKDWERLSHVEYFDKRKKQQFESDAGLKINGAYSRAKPQKSFRINFNNFSGGTTMHYPLIPDKGFISRYEGFTLRNGGQDNGKARLRDAYMQRVVKHTHADYMVYEPALVFLNGEYWGEYEIREKHDEDYIEINHGVPADKVDMLEQSGSMEIKAGSDESFYTMYKYISKADPLSPDFHDKAAELLDLENFADYFITQIYFENNDWIDATNKGNNFRLWHSQLPGGKWRYMLWDIDQGSGFKPDMPNLLNILRTRPNPNMHNVIFKTMINNIEFRNYFIDRYADLMNTIFQYKNMQKIGYSMRDSIMSSMPRHSERWETSYNNWAKEVNIMIDFNKSRIPEARSQIVNEFNLNKQIEVTLDVFPIGAGTIKISTIIPDSLPWSGIYFDGVPVNLTAIPNLGYNFTYWENNKMLFDDSTGKSITLNINADNKFIAHFKGALVVDPELTFSEINYHSDTTSNSGDWVELHNYGSITVNLSGWQLRDKDSSNVFTIPVGTIINPNAYLVLVNDSLKFKERYPQIKNFIGELPFGYSNSSDQVNLFNEKNEKKLSVTYMDTLLWPKGADGNGRTLELIDPKTDLNNGLNWFDGCMGGSPGKEYFSCNENIVFSEINYHPLSSNDAGTWLELHNLTAADIDISGWKLLGKKKDTTSYIIPPQTILPANGYIVLCNNVLKFSSKNPVVNNVVGPLRFSMDKGGGLLRLYDKQGKLEFSVIYDDITPWPLDADGKGKTLEVLDPNGLMNNGLNWFAGCMGGSPGVGYDPNCVVVAVEEVQDSIFKVRVSPNPSNSLITIEVFSKYLKDISCTIYDITGKEIRREKFLNQENKIILDIADFAKGIYSVKITYQKYSTTKKIIFQ